MSTPPGTEGSFIALLNSINMLWERYQVLELLGELPDYGRELFYEVPEDLSNFRYLPLELRLRIWYDALPKGQYIGFETFYYQPTFKTSTKPPATAWVNRESRAVTLEHYSLFWRGFHGRVDQKPVWLNGLRDTLCVDVFTATYPGLYFLLPSSSRPPPNPVETYRSVRVLEVRGIYAAHTHLISVMAMLLLRPFSALEELRMVACHPNQEPIGTPSQYGQQYYTDMLHKCIRDLQDEDPGYCMPKITFYDWYIVGYPRRVATVETIEEISDSDAAAPDVASPQTAGSTVSLGN